MAGDAAQKWDSVRSRVASEHLVHFDNECRDGRREQTCLRAKLNQHQWAEKTTRTKMRTPFASPFKLCVSAMSFLFAPAKYIAQILSHEWLYKGSEYGNSSTKTVQQAAIGCIVHTTIILRL